MRQKIKDVNNAAAVDVVPAQPYVGVIDIGSNSLRLAVYAAHNRALAPLYNEKEICEIGRGLESTGKLNAAGVALALQTLERFKELAEGMGIRKVTMLATAAVREAVDGKAFLDEVLLRTGIMPHVLSGDEEATFAAHGVRYGIPNAAGIMGDLGGGSLELATMGENDYLTSLPLGPLRLMDATGNNMTQASQLIGKHLEKINWLQNMHRKDFYAVGGIWRSIARAHIAASNHPLPVIHMYTVKADEISAFARSISEKSVEEVRNIKGVPARRAESLSCAALLLERIIAFGRPANIVFSASGLREGYLFSQLDAAERKKDPLHVYGAGTRHRFGDNCLTYRLADWMSKLFAGEDDEFSRLRTAACLMSDMSWDEHPEYRAQHAYQHALGLPVGGASHAARCYIALALYARHAGKIAQKNVAEALAMLPEKDAKSAISAGYAMRLAYAITGGSGLLLDGISLKKEKKALVLTLAPLREKMLNATIERRLGNLAENMDLTPEVRSNKVSSKV